MGGNINDLLSTEYLFKGNLDGIDNTTFTPMHLSTIICPQYLRGWGSGIVFVRPHHPCFSSRPHRHSSSYRPHILHTSHGREAASQRHTSTAIAEGIITQNVLLMYYYSDNTLCNSLIINAFDSLCMTPKGSQAFCFHTWRTS